tara:strand:- start:2096 stop:5947 length:3852 start_codon:yes stop_codon:yes gene_type:complete
MVKVNGSFLKSAIERFNNSSNRKLVSSSLRKGHKVKSTKYIVAIDPSTKQLIKGNISQIAKQIKSNPNTIKSRFIKDKKKEKTQYKDIKGFTLLRFENPEDMISFTSNWKSQDAKILKEKSKPILSGAKYLMKLQPEYQIKNDGFHENQFWGTSEHRYKIDFNSDSLTPHQLEQIFKDASLDTIKKMKLKSKDKIRFIIQDPSLQNAISIPLLDVEKYDTNNIMNMINKIYESDYLPGWNIGPETTITITSINVPPPLPNLVGAPPDNPHKLNPFSKSSIVSMKNKDNLCYARAIITGISRVEEGINHKNYDNIKRGRLLQTLRAKVLLNKLGIDPDANEKIDINDFDIHKKVEEITGYQLTIINGDDYNEVLYPDVLSHIYKPPADDNKTIYLYAHQGHIDLISNNKLAGFYAKDYYCHKCKKTYKKKDCHKCKFKCNMCCRSDCSALKIPNSIKKFNIQCEGCKRFFPSDACFNNHITPDDKGKSVCDKVWKCHSCKKVMARDTFPQDTHICGDYKCGNCKQVVHKDHQCYMYPKPLKEPSEKYIFFDFESDISGEFHKVMYSISQYFHSEENHKHYDINEWCEWAFQKDHKGYTFIAHNGKGYDYKFIIQWVYENTDYQPMVIFAGQKIMYMCIKELKIRFIDSLSFITKPLKAFPKIFGEKELKKGFFPHWFNTKENWNYVGPMPPKEMFRPNSFKDKDRDEFMKWYDEKIKENYIWDQKKEMEEYCISDVDILRKCCIKFRQLYLDIAEIDPFQYLTIASVCMAIYKYFYVDTSYAIRYKKLKQLFPENPSSYKDDELEMYNEMKETFDRNTRFRIFMEKKIAVIPFKEVEWIRKSFFGGRTNATKLIYNFKEGEEGMYDDLTSLYPTVNYYEEYPMGHYIKIKGDEIDMEKVRNQEYFGFYDLELTCPKKLYHPVLPRKGNKLFFDLNDKRGVWCSKEVYKAIDLGYKIKKIYEIRYYEKTTKSLFKEYVAKFLKIKQEASGFPKWVKTEKDKKKYIALYHSNQGILMDKEKIIKNAGLREIAKLCLNSLWGKFGQRTNLGKCVILKNKEEFYKILQNPEYENINFLEISSNPPKLQVSYQIKDKYVENDFNTNIAIASFTTSTARLRLYQGLEYLNEQVLYFDTDSIVYKYNKDDPTCNRQLTRGDYLGDWTDELEGNKMINVFVSGGPKNYSYETDDGMYHSKVKGFNLNYEASLRINHLSMIDLVKSVLTKTEEEEEKKIAIEYDTIRRGAGHTLSNEHQIKNYGMVYDKRSILPVDKYGNYDTIPFGYENTKL